MTTEVYDNIKRVLIIKLKKKYKDDYEHLITLLEDVKLNNYNKLYGDYLFNCFIMLLKETKDKDTVGYFINDLLREV